MAVRVDPDLCTGCGICIEACSEVFTSGEDNKAQVIKDTCSSCNLEEIANSCPTGAIELV